jgi:hypothetical protein
MNMSMNEAEGATTALAIGQASSSKDIVWGVTWGRVLRSAEVASVGQ